MEDHDGLQPFQKAAAAYKTGCDPKMEAAASNRFRHHFPPVFGPLVITDSICAARSLR